MLLVMPIKCAYNMCLSEYENGPFKFNGFTIILLANKMCSPIHIYVVKYIYTHFQRVYISFMFNVRILLPSFI